MQTLKEQSTNKRDIFDGTRDGAHHEGGLAHSSAVQGDVGAAVSNLGEAASNIRNAATHAVPAAKEQFDRASDAIVITSSSIEQSIAKNVREKPLNSVIMAAGIGMLFGLFMFRR